ncbi:MAG: hypothetical protein AB1921_05140 [Thermodesulfobacteriota bacterium]
MRNLDCPKYDNCLSNAAKSNVPDFDCGPCQHSRVKAPTDEIDITAYHLLLRAIFSPEQYAVYRGAKGTRKPRKRSAYMGLAHSAAM